MATINRFEDLDIWQKAREYDKKIFAITLYDLFSKDFRFKDQIRASSGSIMDNVAEGFERDGNKEFILFLSYSKGSAGEVRSQLYRAFDRGYISQEECEILVNEVLELSKSISGFINYLKNSEYKGRKFT